MPKDPPYSLIVVGAGAAGCFAALEASRDSEGAVLLVDAGARPLNKVRISGGGRCNVTHACFAPRDLTENYPRGGRELRGPFHKFQPRDTITWFASRGVELKAEPDGRMFPTTDTSQTIIDCFLQNLENQKVPLHLRQRIRSLQRDVDGFFILERDQEAPLKTKHCLLAPGSLASSPLRDSLKTLGHTLTETVPSLFTFRIDDPELHALAGVSVSEATVAVPGFARKQSGPVLITHWGLSGPAVLKMSAWAARYLHGKDYHFICTVRWIPDNPEDIRQKLQEQRKNHPRRRVQADCPFALPRRLWEYLCRRANLEDCPWSQLPAKSAKQLITDLSGQPFSVKGKSTFKEEFVTCGGVNLREVDFRTMESRRCQNLFFAGECLDIDGVTGGFNFQAAWTTGYLAGQTLRTRLEREAVDLRE
ncbi:MAG: NAD(P)/FAD-dependent oxidoreductase [Opitutales bacterium]|nr:NAD(P)/FAD-dependent oxidoreductase [Opitutales bacterium]